MQRRIVCAANRHPETKRIILGARHFDHLMRQAAKDTGLKWTASEQGFIDERGNFLTREEAWVVAEKAGQIVRRVGGDSINGGHLFSENLY